MEEDISPVLALKRDEIRFEVSRLTSLIGLCDERGIIPGISQADIDALVLPFLSEPTDLGYVAVSSRLAKMHRHLHELLYAPPQR